MRLLNDDGLMSWSPSHEFETAEEQRLQQAEEAFRLFGSRFHAFARTERLAVLALHVLRYKPEDAGRGFLGLSNSIGQYGQTRHENWQLVERSLKATGGMILIHDKLVAGCFWRPYLDAVPDFLSNEALLCYSEPP